MALLDDINTARTGIEARNNELRTGIAGSDNRYSFDNADQQDSWAGRWAGADTERLRQLNLLSQAVQDPSWTASLDNEVAKRKDAGFAQADYGHRQGEDQRKTGAAKGGTAGGSWDAVVQAQNAQEMARVKATVTQQVSELKAAGIQNLEEMGKQLLSKAIAGGNESASMGIAGQGTQAGYSADNMITANDQQYRGLLADTLSKFVSNSVTPAVTMGFDSAGRYNQQMRNDYTDARDTGAYKGNFQDWASANGGSKSWWGF